MRGLFEGGTKFLLLKFISSIFLCNVVDSSLLFFVSSLTTKSKRSFYIIYYNSLSSSTKCKSAKAILCWRLLKIFAVDAALIRGVELKVVLIQSKAVSKSGTLSLSLLLILQYILEVFNETKFNETIFVSLILLIYTLELVTNPERNKKTWPFRHVDYLVVPVQRCQFQLLS